MPSPYVKKLASELDIPIAEVEEKWKEAKQVTADTFGKKISEFGDREYAYTIGVIKKMYGITESYIKQFLDSEMTAEDFVNHVIDGKLNENIVPVEPPEEEVPVDEVDETPTEESIEEDDLTETEVIPESSEKLMDKAIEETLE